MGEFKKSRLSKEKNRDFLLLEFIPTLASDKTVLTQSILYILYLRILNNQK